MKNRLLVAAKICLSFGLIFWLLRGADLATIWEKVQSADPWFLGLAFAMFYVGFGLMSLRWRILLRVEELDAPFWYLFRSINIAVLFNNLLPSIIGGDAYRMYDVWRLGGTKTKSVAIIFIDRFLGMFALVTYGAVASLLIPEIGEAIPGLALYLVGILVAMLVIMWMVFGSGQNLLHWFLALDSRLLSIPQKIVSKISGALALYRGRGDVLIKALLISYGIQFNVVVHFIVVALALNLNVPPLAMFIIIPVATLIMLMPVSINGIGVRETILVFLFGIYAVSSESAIAFAWVWLAMLLAQGIVGGIVFLFRKNRPSASKVQDLMDQA